jgi:hypothetical protein
MFHMRSPTRSAVGFTAVLDGEDEDGIAVIVEAHTVVTDAQAQFGRLEVLKALYVARVNPVTAYTHCSEFGKPMAPWQADVHSWASLTLTLDVSANLQERRTPKDQRSTESPTEFTPGFPHLYFNPL